MWHDTNRIAGVNAQLPVTFWNGDPDYEGPHPEEALVTITSEDMQTLAAARTAVQLLNAARPALDGRISIASYGHVLWLGCVADAHTGVIQMSGNICMDLVRLEVTAGGVLWTGRIKHDGHQQYATARMNWDDPRWPESWKNTPNDIQELVNAAEAALSFLEAPGDLNDDERANLQDDLGSVVEMFSTKE